MLTVQASAWQYGMALLKCKCVCMRAMAGVDPERLVELIAEASSRIAGGTGAGPMAQIAHYMFPGGLTCAGDRRVGRLPY